jgi:phage-related protein
MEFKIEFYESAQGKCPVRDFLDEIKATYPYDFAVILAGINKLKLREYQRPPLSKELGDGLYELRHVGKVNTRIFYFFARDRRIILVHGFIKKGRKVPKRERKVALDRKSDWEERHLR